MLWPSRDRIPISYSRIKLATELSHQAICLLGLYTTFILGVRQRSEDHVQHA